MIAALTLTVISTATVVGAIWWWIVGGRNLWQSRRTFRAALADLDHTLQHVRTVEGWIVQPTKGNSELVHVTCLCCSERRWIRLHDGLLDEPTIRRILLAGQPCRGRRKEAA